MQMELSRNSHGHEAFDSSLGDRHRTLQNHQPSQVDSLGKRNVVKRGPKKRGKYHGVSRDRRMKKWRAQITINGNDKYLGCHDDPITAAKVYDSWARRFHGGRATLNFP